jgi:C-terminal processing protease CtpA/Prc
MRRGTVVAFSAFALLAATAARADLLPPPDYVFTPGFSVVYKEGRPVVEAVVPDSPAAAAGIFQGDHVLAVDRMDGAVVPENVLDRALHGPEGSEVQVIVSDQGGFVTSHLLVRTVED